MVVAAMVALTHVLALALLYGICKLFHRRTGSTAMYWVMGFKLASSAIGLLSPRITWPKPESAVLEEHVSSIINAQMMSQFFGLLGGALILLLVLSEVHRALPRDDGLGSLDGPMMQFVHDRVHAVGALALVLLLLALPIRYWLLT